MIAKALRLRLPLITVGTSIAILSSWVSVAAQSNPPAPPKEEQKIKVIVPAEDVPVPAGQKVAIDPQTGKIRPLTPEEARALAEARKKPEGESRELIVTYYTNGMVTVELTEDYLDAVVAKVNPDGTISMNHVRGLKEAAAAAAAGQPSASSEAREAKTQNGKVQDKSTKLPQQEEIKE